LRAGASRKVGRAPWPRPSGLSSDVFFPKGKERPKCWAVAPSAIAPGKGRARGQGAAFLPGAPGGRHCLADPGLIETFGLGGTATPGLRAGVVREEKEGIGRRLCNFKGLGNVRIYFSARQIGGWPRPLLGASGRSSIKKHRGKKKTDVVRQTRPEGRAALALVFSNPGVWISARWPAHAGRI